MILYIATLIGGFILLVWGAERFVHGAAACANNLGISPLIIGLTVVGLGTSAPEMLVSAVAAMQDNTGLAIGNAIGSNIANIGLILGITALTTPLIVNSSIIKRELPVLLAITILGYVLLIDGELGFIDGLILIATLILFLSWLIISSLQQRKTDVIEQEFSEEIPTDMSTGRALFWLVIGMIVLLLSSKLLVWAAVEIATTLGVSDLIIGLTIIALGTSLPELAASIASALKNEPDIAIGNIIGSNIFNILAVLSIPGLINPGGFASVVISRDYPIMLILTIVLIALSYGYRKNGCITRVEGALLLFAYGAYQTLLYFNAQ
ncbi:MAG: calcium/sodium antiporter [Gammaproteobacteria bacterium]|nr:calcium/sodium antiporter [Gammaproteobacteria bacterium]